MEEEKNPRSADSNLHSILQKSSNAHEVVAADKNAWQLFKQRLLEEDVKANVGICMIVFALPILIPGVTLTAVAFDDETGFSKYSSLHIIGMIMLGLSVLLVLMGIFLNVSSKSKVSPDDRIRAVSTHEKPLKTLDSEIAGAAHSQGDKSISVKSTHNAASVNFMVESGNTAAGGDHRVHIKVHEVGASSRSGLAFSNPMHKNSPGLRSSDLPCVTSSEDENSSSFNSDDYSHGSYVISEDCDACSQHDAHDVSFPSDKQRIRPKSCLLTSDLRKSQGISKTTTEQKQMSLQNSMLSKSDTILLSGKSLSHQSSNGVNRNNYFTGDTSGSSFAHLGGISESVRGEGRPRTSCLVVRDVDGRYSQASSDKSASSLSPARHNVRFSQPGATSPGTRQRLQGLCIDSIISPSEFTSDSQVEIENNFADTIADTGSCSSVFLNEERHAQDISSRNNSIELKDASQEMTTYSSGYQPEPLAMPIHLRQSSGPVNRNSSPGEEHMARQKTRTTVTFYDSNEPLTPADVYQPTAMLNCESSIHAPLAIGHTSGSSLQDSGQQNPLPRPRKTPKQFSLPANTDMHAGPLLQDQSFQRRTSVDFQSWGNSTVSQENSPSSRVRSVVREAASQCSSDGLSDHVTIPFGNSTREKAEGYRVPNVEKRAPLGTFSESESATVAQPTVRKKKKKRRKRRTKAKSPSRSENPPKSEEWPQTQRVD